MKGRLTLALGLVAILGCPGDDSGRTPDDSAIPTGGGSGSGSGTADDGEDTEDDGTDNPTSSNPTTMSDDSPSDGDTDPSTSGEPTDGTDTQGDTPGPWLLTIDNAASPPMLVLIDSDTGAGEARCQFPSSSYNSVALGRDGTLYAHNASQGRIERFDPCDCGFQIVGPTSAGTLEIAVGEDDTLLGLAPGLDAFYEINPETGLANAIGPLGFDFFGASLTWSEKLGAAYAVDDMTSQLFSIDPVSGAATTLITLSETVTNPGLAYRPDTDTLYLCSADTLYQLNPLTGMLTELGPIGLTAGCTSLAAPRLSESCLE